MNKAKEKPDKQRRPRKPRKKFNISYEILPPGTLKRNPSSLAKAPAQRWEEVIDICAEIVADSGCE